MVDEACKTADDTTLRAMENHFVMCCKLEHMFWDQAAELLQWPDFVGQTSINN
jgi:thiaminase/transcriptional activator TenA